ncbi:MAG: MCE family protein [Alphaproteobacteria bacterium]|nr:MCE family protein [Alphaproteobacteria bacterium]MCB9696617.1 MCE family protein [Alphaproteobacteria bacterium]
MAQRQDIAVGCLLVVALGAAAVMATFAGAFRGGWSTIEVTVPAADVAGLQQGADVAVVGIRVGRVERLELKRDQALVHLRLDPDADLRQDTTARIRARSVLGEKYLELVPHDPDAPLLRDGDVLAPIGPQVEIDELVTMLGPLVEAVDPEVLRDVAASLAEALRDDPQRVTRMLGNLELVLDRAATASEDLPALAAEGRSTLAVARQTMSHVDARAVEAKATLARADDALAKLQTASDPLPETVEEAKAAVADVRALVGRFDDATDTLDTILANLSEIDKEELERLLRDEGVRIRFSKRRKR